MADGGVSSDALGTILTWMQERTSSVFVIATANDVGALPPEMLRKGRWDEIFFVDLPSQQERIEILETTVKKFNLSSADLKLETLAAACSQFSGAELAALIPEAMFTAFNDGARKINHHDLMEAAAATVPLAKSTNSEKINNLRKWAKDQTRPASRSESVGKGNRFKNLN